MEDTLAHIPQEALEEVVRELPADEVERTEERLEELAKEVWLLPLLSFPLSSLLFFPSLSLPLSLTFFFILFYELTKYNRVLL